MPDLTPVMKPTAGERLQRFVGDWISFTLEDREGRLPPEGWRARLRTNLGRADVLCKEITQAHTKKLPLAGASWHDLPMHREGGKWVLDLPLVEPGYFKAKAYMVDANGWQHWPDEGDVGISVHPDSYRTANTIYCAFTRMFGATRTMRSTENPKQTEQFKQLDAQGYTIIPPSGKFRDLIQQLPHIVDTLGCRILHLLPVNPTPTTFARYGRFGSPYASLDLTGIDPALVEFDRRTTGVDQFRELTYATHAKGARVFLDIVVNHTGWGSNLQENHPGWFLRGQDGTFVSPGAWGTTWEDLVELEHRYPELWDYLAESLLEWCRRGVDGFRCDAGYKVPLPAWQYITARIRQEFPNTIFLLEGLGGAWELTERLLTEGGMQWAYSELFQNYSGEEVARYLDHSLTQSQRIGLLVHYSETHDNERLATRGRSWSLLRNRLCALASISGGFGFTCGVEWLAPERVNVHSSCGLAWDNPDNLVAELGRLNRLLADHPCFFDGAKVTRLSPANSPVYALRRDAEDGNDSVVVLVNNDTESSRTIALAEASLEGLTNFKFELCGQRLPKAKLGEKVEFILEAGASYCLSNQSEPQGLSGDAYRLARTQAAWALTALGQMLPIEEIPAVDWRDVARAVNKNPAAVLAACSAPDARLVRQRLEPLHSGVAHERAEYYAPVVIWNLLDHRRILPVPPGHWLLVEDSAPFRATLRFDGETRPQHVQSILVQSGHVASFPPRQPIGEAQLELERYALTNRAATGQIRFLAPGPDIDSQGESLLAVSNLTALQDVASTSREVKSAAKADYSIDQPIVLLTNGIGGMARLCVDFGAIKSKYDCLLGANLHPRVPVDRHIFAKRARAWVVADGFINPLDLRNLASFEPGPPAIWKFIANAGDGRTVEIWITAAMLPGRNTTVLRFERPASSSVGKDSLPESREVRLTVRVDIEDRNFHTETKRNGGAEYHFSTHARPLDKKPGFSFVPASDRHLRVFADAGIFHPQVEWCENIPHPVEQSRGQVGSGDAYSPGWFDLPMSQAAAVSLVVCADAQDTAPEEIQISTASPNPDTIAARAKTIFAQDDAFGRQLLRAADAFVVRRDEGVTVIAGYPWFLDWGRDSLICARGLLTAGMEERVKELLVTFGRFARDGTLPNTIHGDDASNRDTSDAPLWYGIVCEETAALLGESLYQVNVNAAGRTIADVLADIAAHYSTSTPNGIRMDSASGLIWSPSHFTWMDTNYPAGTPREGYPVEIQVLWIRLLRQLQRVGKPAERKRWQDLADQAQATLLRFFWLDEPGYLSDLLIAKGGQPAANAVADNALRSNQLFAVSLGLLSGAQAQRSVQAALQYLVIPGALRTLAPLPVAPPLPIYGNQGQLLNNPVEPYWGRYEGEEDTRRKPAYHNGTAWTWTFPMFCEALARAWDCAPEAVAAAKAYLGSMDRLMMDGCIGQIPEITDGDVPHVQRGCDAQAWGVTEALRVWKFLQNSKAAPTGK